MSIYVASDKPLALRQPDYRCDDGESDLECEEPTCGRRVRVVYFSGLLFVCRECAAAEAVPVVIDGDNVRDCKSAA